MELLLIIGLVVFIYLMMPKASASVLTAGKFIVEVKKCPPHQWDWQEIVDKEGVKQGERIVCKVCGPLSKLLDGSQE